MAATRSLYLKLEVDNVSHRYVRTYNANTQAQMDKQTSLNSRDLNIAVSIKNFRDYHAFLTGTVRKIKGLYMSYKLHNV